MDSKTHVFQKVLKFLLKMTGGDTEVVQEVLQDTWAAALKSYATFKHKSTYFTWICRIALNKLADYYRGQTRRRSKIFIPSVEQFNRIMDPRISAEEKLSLDELKSQVNKCLNLLPSQYRRLLQLKYYEELSSRQISLNLGLSPRSREGKLYRARKRLAQIYAQFESSPSTPASGSDPGQPD